MRTGHRRWWGLGALVLLVVALGVWWVLRPVPYVVAPGAHDGEGAPRARPAEAARTLADLVNAVVDDDPAAGATLGAGRATELLSAVVTNGEELRVVDFDLRYVDEIGAVGADGTWQAAVDVTWRFDGFDAEAAREEVLVGFRTVGERVVVASLGGGDRRTPLWLAGPLEVRRTTQSLVMVRGDASEADLLSRRAAAAVPVVRRVLSAWPGKLVIEVPSSSEDLDTTLDADPGTYANIAAVTATVDGSLAPGAPIHIFVNPTVYDVLEPIGAQVVINHEATHVATDAPLHTLPLWLLEGFADYVALRDVELPIATTAGQIIAEVRADGVPEALPDQTDFDAASDDLGAAYESAWLVCQVLADRSGEQALVATYQRVSDGGELPAVLRAESGLGVPGLTRAWRSRLQDLAG